MLITLPHMTMEMIGFVIGFIVLALVIMRAIHQVHVAVDSGVHSAPLHAYTACAIVAGRIVSIQVIAPSLSNAEWRARKVFRNAEYLSVTLR